ncbi:MAG TPA: dihydrolipoyl dehydrogenase [Caldilineae bacterium]|nr:dihydrolipoyl dehydrogenase [Caldilineae bacterium]
MAEPADIYDVVVIGGGPGGYVAAIRAAQLGLRVAVVEREALGGICLNWGCIPTKALLRSAEVVDLLKRGKEFGFSFENLTLDYGRAIKRSREVSSRLVRGVNYLMRKNNIEVIQGTGRLEAPDQVAVEPDGKVLKARNIILATGARPRSIPGVTIDGDRVITSREALECTELPGRIIIVGAGPIGLEFAHIYHAYGVEVTVVEMLSRIAPLEDEEISVALARSFQRRGVKLHTDTRVEGVESTDQGVRVRVATPDGEQMLEADTVLMAIGVQPNSEDLGLEKVGVQVERGAVVVDGYMRTNVPGIYAIGDLTGKMPLAHVASAQGIVAAEHIAGREPEPIEDYTWMPRCIYCQPQVASMGLTEAQARERGYDVRIGQFPFQANGKALGLGEREGFVKIVADAKYGEILGAHLIGPEVTELLPELVLARAWELTVEEIALAVHAHPTLSEALMEAAHATLGQAIHT